MKISSQDCRTHPAKRVDREAFAAFRRDDVVDLLVGELLRRAEQAVASVANDYVRTTGSNCCCHQLALGATIATGYGCNWTAAIESRR